MQLPKSLFIFIGLILLTKLSIGQSNIDINHRSNGYGLSYRWVYDITQDEMGFIWMANHTGLRRYDGSEYVTYQHEDGNPKSLSVNTIVEVVSNDEYVWALGIDSVFNRINIHSGEISHIKLPENESNPNIRFVHAGELRNGDFLLLLQTSKEKADQNIASLWIFHPKENKFVQLMDVDTDQEEMHHFSETSDGRIWLWGKKKNFYLVDLNEKIFERHQNSKNEQNRIGQIDAPIDINRSFWYPLTTLPDSEESNFLSSFEIPNHIDIFSINHLSVDNKNGIWFYHSDNEVFRYDTEFKDFESFSDPIFNGSDRKQLMRHYYVDKEGGYWNGHYVGAIRFTSRKNLFNQYFQIINKNKDLSKARINCGDILELSDEFLIVKDVEHKIYTLNLRTNYLREIPLKSRDGNIENNNPEIFSMLLDNDKYIWATSPGAILKIEISTGKIDYYHSKQLSSHSSIEGFNNFYFHRIFKDASERLWVCDREGIFMLDKQSGKLNPVLVQHVPSSVGTLFEFATYDPKEDKIYAIYQRGIYIIDCKNESSSLVEIMPEEKSYDLLITSVLKKGNSYWLATNKGLLSYNINSNSLTSFSRRAGLSSNIVLSVIASNNDLWLSTQNGLVQFNPKSFKATNYHVSEGLITNEFNIWSYLKSRSGNMFFGGPQGIIGFNPENFDMPEGKEGALQLSRITSLNKHNKVIRTFSKPDNLSQKIKFSAKEKNLSFKVFNSAFDDQQQRNYMYFLEGLETNWINNGNNAEIKFSHPPPGKYTLRVKSTGPNKLEPSSEIAFPVIILNNWYKRWWAIGFYMILGSYFLWLLYNYQLRQRLAQQEALRIKEVDELKTKMYTNITHEFRTPLTVILGMNDVISKTAIESSESRLVQASEMIKRNGKNLLNLINQLLDLSKLESGKLETNKFQENIIIYLKYLLESYQSYAAEKEIKLIFQSDREELLMDFDKNKISHILGNLVTNSIKHCSENGQIDVKLQKVGKKNPFLELRVKDNGVGIPEDQLDLIFDRFYQVDGSNTRKSEGTGIGLFLVREVVSLLQGSIKVESEVNKGTEFIVKLPITNQEELVVQKYVPPIKQQKEKTEILASIESKENYKNDLPLVLIVEDNPDVAKYLDLTFEDKYRTLLARNGKEGIEKAIEIIPDLIVSDVMMPIKDGFELCNTVKTDERTSHIPIILLTAKVDGDSKIEGLEKGADAYLAKPFNKKEMLIRVKNLLKIRAELQKRFSQNDFSKVINKDVPEIDAFLIKAKEIVLENLDNESFSIPELCKLLYISRAQLHRKLTALTGHSASHLLRSIRLEKAQELLLTHQLNVSEVAYQVGFKTQAHFSRTFSEALGVSPSEFQSK